MFEKLLEWVRKTVDRLIPKQDIAQALRADTEVSGEMVSAVDLWMRLYTGRPPWLWDERGRRDDSIQTLGLPATIAAKVAKLVTLEMQAEVSGGARAAYLQDQLAPLLKGVRRYTEYACAQGGLVFRPYIDGGSLAIDMTQAAGLDTVESSARLRQWQDTQRDFLQQTGLKRQSDREHVAGFGREQARKVAADAKRSTLTNAAGQRIIVVKRTTITGDPDSITQKENANGGIDRNYYGSDGKQIKQISNHDHGHAEESKLGTHGEHAHDYSWSNDQFTRGKARGLTPEERKENQDFL